MKERFFMGFENPAVDLLWSIDQWQGLRSDWSRAPLRQVRKNNKPLRSEGASQILSALAIGLGRTKIRN
jgi:hypothetical protein